MTNLVEVRGVSHRYGRTPALVDVDLDVGPGECVVLLGPNGAGKTTLVELIIGLRVPQSGMVQVVGGDPRRAATRRRLGVVQQSLGFPTTLTVDEAVRGAAVRGGRSRRAAGPVLEELGLTPLARRRAARLSGGQQKLVELAMALATAPTLLVLDEPSSGLDVRTRRELWRIIAARRAAGTGVLVTTHLIEESRTVADRVVVLDHGRVLADEPPETLITKLPDRTVIARTALDHDRLSRLPGLVSVERDGHRVRLGTRAPEDLLRVLLAEDPTLTDLRIEGAHLEEAVVALLDKPTNDKREVPA